MNMIREIRRTRERKLTRKINPRESRLYAKWTGVLGLLFSL